MDDGLGTKKMVFKMLKCPRTTQEISKRKVCPETRKGKGWKKQRLAGKQKSNAPLAMLEWRSIPPDLEPGKQNGN